MSDPHFRIAQRDGLYDSHMEPINRLVDSLAGEGRGWLPHVAPAHGGARAQLLWLLRDPGPATADPENEGRGFLCAENDDATAQRLCELLDQADIDLSQTMPWNAYPWYINRAPKVAELRAGTSPLRRLLALLPELRVVLLLGNEAQRAWRLLEESQPAATAHLTAIPSRHTGAQAFIGTAAQRSQWRSEQEAVFRKAGRLLSA